jgi:hypothetical protein
LRSQNPPLIVREFASDALSTAEIKSGEVGIVSGIPEQHLRRRVIIYSPGRTATQQGSGKLGKWKINFVSTQKWENPLMGWTSTGDPYANVGESGLYFKRRAARRPKNSALEVELEFDHNTRPAPVITEEVTSSLEDIIKRRIAEEQFDDVQPKPALPSTAPKERVKLDESKSEKGLGEIYEAEYMQRTGLASAPVSSSDALKKEV